MINNSNGPSQTDNFKGYLSIHSLTDIKSRESLLYTE